VIKTRSYFLVNALINHPDIRPTLEAGGQYLDSRELLTDSENIIYAGEEGVVIFTHEYGRLYRGHVGFRSEYRGATALRLAKECLDDLFVRLDDVVVVAAVPLLLRQARLFCKMLGFVTKTIDHEQEWMVYEGGSNGRLN
jgi:hypothetical protein